MGGEGQPAVAETEAGGVAVEAKTDPWKPEPQPIREDQVGNAVKFLSNPKVQTSPIVHRRSFLERKGLTREEIDEAFRRVPDPPASAAVATVAPPSSDTQARAATAAVVPAQGQGVGQRPTGLSWGQKVLGLGGLVTAAACTGVATKVYLLPKFKAWVRSVLLEEMDTEKKVSPPSPGFLSAEEPPANEAATAAAATAAAAAASEVAAAMREFAHARVKESQQLGSIIKALETQTQELKSALTGMRDVVNNNSSDSAPIRGYGTDVWRTPEMPRPSGLVADRTYAGVVTAPPPAESSDNESPPIGS